MTIIHVSNNSIMAKTTIELDSANTLNDDMYTIVSNGFSLYKTKLLDIKNFIDSQYQNILSGLMPAMIFSAPSGAVMVNGAYAPITDLLTFSTGSKRVIGPAGKLVTVGANQPAYDWSSGRHRVLIETGSATNWLPYGLSPGLSGWSKAGAATATGGVADPSGGTTATHLSVGGSTDAIYCVTTGGGAGAVHTPSVFIHRGSTSGVLTIRNSAGAAYGLWSVNFALLPDAWVRVTRTHPAVTVITPWTAKENNAVGLQFYADGGTLTFDTWAAQVETGAVTSSPILTDAGAAVTRIADDVRLAPAALAVFRSYALSLVLRGSLIDPPPILSRVIFEAKNGTGSELIQIYQKPSETVGQILKSSGVSQPVATLANTGGDFGLAVAFMTGVYRASLNGSATVETAITSPDRTAMTQVVFGNPAYPARFFLDEIVMWPFAGSAAGLAAQAHVYGA